MRLFVDTNIVVDYLDNREGFSQSARKLMILGFLGEFELWMSASQITDLFYILTNGGRAFQSEKVKGDIRKLRRFMHVCSLGAADVDAALDSTWDDFEDNCLYQCACKTKVDAIITRNKKDFAKSSIKVFDCDGWFAYLEKNEGLTYEEIPF